MLAGDVIEIVGIVKKTVGRVLTGHGHIDHPLSPWVRRRLKQDEINQAEDGRVSADTKTEDQNRRDGEAGRLKQEAECMAEGEHGGASDW